MNPEPEIMAACDFLPKDKEIIVFNSDDIDDLATIMAIDRNAVISLLESKLKEMREKHGNSGLMGLGRAIKGDLNVYRTINAKTGGDNARNWLVFV